MPQTKTGKCPGCKKRGKLFPATYQLTLTGAEVPANWRCEKCLKENPTQKQGVQNGH
jgi:hypothetical protein